MQRAKACYECCGDEATEFRSNRHGMALQLGPILTKRIDRGQSRLPAAQELNGAGVWVGLITISPRFRIHPKPEYDRGVMHGTNDVPDTSGLSLRYLSSFRTIE